VLVSCQHCKDPLRIIAWNINHRARRKRIPAALPAGILSLDPYVVVLTEYVEGPDHERFCEDLKACDFDIQITPKQEGAYSGACE
jgi:hypothetical protein